MVRLRRIRKWGNSLVIPLTMSDAKDFNAAEHDEADIEDIQIIKKKLSNKTIKEVKEARSRIKKGEYHTEEQAAKLLGVKKK